jgi:predicted Zn-dependent protease
MKRLSRMVVLLASTALAACTAGAGLQLLSSPDEKLRVEQSAHKLVKALPPNVSRRLFTFQIVGDDRASGWNIAPGIIYISQAAVRNASDDELTQFIAHSLGHDLLAHPVIETDISDARQAAEIAAVAVVPGGIVLAGIAEGLTRGSEYTIAQEIEADRIGLRLWLRSGQTCAMWISLRQAQKAHGKSWHEPIKDVAPPFDNLIATAMEECVGRQ